MTLIREIFMRYRRLLLSLAPMALLVSCSDQITQPSAPRDPGTPPSFAIVDGAHGGNAQFYFLPPLVPTPSYSGTFDASQSPVVSICELAGTTCGAIVASFSGSAVKLDLDAEAYRASWKTKDAGLDPAKTYRIQVLVGTQVLGYADVVVLSNGSQIKTVDKNQFVSVINGGVLQIRFRIEGGAVTPPGRWQNGDLVTYSQDAWGGDPTTSTAAATLLNRFDFRYPTGIEVGLLGGAGFSMSFTSAVAVLDFLPASGAYGPLNSDLLDPTSSASGAYGGLVLALQLNVDFTDSGDIAGTSGLAFGDLRLCGLTATPGYNNLTVRQFLAAMNSALGGGPAAYGIDEIANLTNDVSLAFEGGAPSSFAQAHLVNGTCPGGWQNGDLVTYNQINWGDPVSTAGVLLAANYDPVYFPTGATLEVGLPGAAGFSMTFTDAGSVLAYNPSVGTVGPLNADLLNPTSSASGAYGGEVVALKLNVDFSDANVLGPTSIEFGSLLLCGFSAQPALNGMAIRDFLNVNHNALGGGTPLYPITDLFAIAQELNGAFEGGSPTLFAQTHVFNGTCPGGWQNGDVITHTQVGWGDPSSVAGILLNARYDFVYAGTGGLLEIGIAGASGYSILFSSASAILNYQPAQGAIGPLNADLVDPTSSASGAFGGEVLALQLNVDFSESGETLGSSGLRFGNLTLCNFTSLTALNGTSVRSLLAMANTALGGGAATYAITDLFAVAEQLNAAFESGSPSSFAQNHLVNGTCP